MKLFVRRLHERSRIPEFAFGETKRRWTIGEQYDLSEYEPGVVGVLSTAMVSEHDKAAHLAFHLQDGRNIIVKSPLSDVELAAYRQHPETFFGVHLRVGKQARNPLDLFEFLYDNYKNTPRQRLLEFLKSAPDFDELAKLPDDELLLVFCDRHVGAVVHMASKGKTGEPAPV